MPDNNIELSSVVNGVEISATYHKDFSHPMMIWAYGKGRDEAVDLTYEEAKIAYKLLGELLEKMEWEDEQPK